MRAATPEALEVVLSSAAGKATRMIRAIEASGGTLETL